MDAPKKVVTAADYPRLKFLAPMAAYFDNYFRITDRESSYYYEFVGGMTTFFAMCYIIALNGVIVAGPNSLTKKMSFFATCLSSGIFTLLMGVMVNIPVALAPGMGLNGYFASVVASNSLSWTDTMGAVFLSGILYLFFTFTGLRAMLFRAVPPSLRSAIVVGIGFFITIIGLKIGEIIRISVLGMPIGSYSDIPFWDYEIGVVNFNKNPPARVAVLGLMFVSFFSTLKVPGAVIISIILTTFCGINYKGDSLNTFVSGANAVTPLGDWHKPGGPDFLPDMNEIPSGKLTFSAINTEKFWEVVWTFLFVELFDSFGTLVGTMTRAKLMKDPVKGMEIVNRAMCIDGFGLSLGAIIGSNSITCYIESNTGIEAGARTGLASFVTGACFLLSLLFVAPFVLIIPDAATACALIIVGVLSMEGVKDIEWKDFNIAFSCFLTIAAMGFTYSIANGICAGFIFYSFLQIVRWSFQFVCQKLNKQAWMFPADVDCNLPHPLMIIISIFMVIRFAYLGA